MRIERNDVSDSELRALHFRTVFKIALIALFVCLFSALGFGCADAEQPLPENLPSDVDVVIPSPAPEIEEHNVSFVVEGNTYSSSKVKHGELVRPPAPPTLDPSAEFSFSFVGWFVDDTPFDFASAITSDIVLVAKFDSVKNKFPVLFYIGDTLYSSSLITYGECAQAPSAPTKPATAEATYTFLGWFDEGELFDFSSPITTDKTLTARFSSEPTTFSVSFLVDAASYSTATVPYGGHAQAPTAPSKPDTLEHSFTFLGWFDGNELFDFSSAITSNVSLSARFSSARRNYTVSFYVDNEVFATADTQYGLPVRPPLPPEPIVVGNSVTVFSHWELVSSEYTFSPVTSDVRLDAKFISAELISSATPPESSDGSFALSVPEGVTSVDFFDADPFDADPAVLDNLVALFLPASLKTLDPGNLFGCYSIRAIAVDPDNPTFRSEGNCVIDRETSSLVVGCRGSVIPDEVTSISDYAFTGIKIPYVYIPGSVRTVGALAFNDCSLLSSLFISPGVTTLSDYAIQNCTSLSLLVVPASLDTIELDRFPTDMSIIFLGSRSEWLNSPLAPLFPEDAVEIRQDYITPSA